jgi:hypothetical protein
VLPVREQLEQRYGPRARGDRSRLPLAWWPGQLSPWENESPTKSLSPALVSLRLIKLPWAFDPQTDGPPLLRTAVVAEEVCSEEAVSEQQEVDEIGSVVVDLIALMKVAASVEAELASGDPKDWGQTKQDSLAVVAVSAESSAELGEHTGRTRGHPRDLVLRTNSSLLLAVAVAS